MSWDKQKDKDDIGYFPNEHGNSVLEWHERSPERTLIASGKFLESPLVILARKTSKDGNRDYIRCPGSGGFKSHFEFEKDEICRKCPYRDARIPVYPLIDQGAKEDLAGITPKYTMGIESMLVPTGCPCAKEHSDAPHRSYPNIVGLYDGAKIIPKAWKISWDGTRLRLSFHFRRLFVSETLKFANDGFFQHLVADLDTGKTYISDVTDGSRTVGTHRSRPVADITYTGSSAYLYDKLPPAETSRALHVFEDCLKKKLRERGFDPRDLDDQEYSKIEKIACLNRFPRLAGSPFPGRWFLPDRLQRKVSSSPRNEDVAGLAKYLGANLDSEALAEAEVFPCVLENVLILKELGCEDDKVLSWACLDSVSNKIGYFLKRIIAKANEDGFDGIDLLEIMLPRISGKTRWDNIVYEMAAMGEEALKRNSSWISDFVENAISGAVSRDFPVSDSLRTMVTEVSDVDKRKNCQKLVEIDFREKDAFRQSKERWKIYPLDQVSVEEQVNSSPYSYGLNSYYDFLNGKLSIFVIESADTGEKAHIMLQRSLGLDRRKWRGKLRASYKDGTWDGEIPKDAFTCSYEFLKIVGDNLSNETLNNRDRRDAFEKATAKWMKKHYVKGNRNSISLF